MKFSSVLLTLAVVLSLASCCKKTPQCGENINGVPTPTSYCGVADTVDLIVGTNTKAGKVVVGNDADFTYVTFITNPGYTLKSAHLFAEQYTGTLPPLPNDFPNNATFCTPYPSTYTFMVPKCDVMLVAAKAVLKKNNTTCDAWGNGTKMTTMGYTGMGFLYTERACVAN